tara:strand:+ start:28575 stop:31724 length:3150 start_codon:yes stop_codon:yes gene_type:complete
MPKEIQSIKQFQGGLNKYSDPRDIQEDESSVLNNINPRFTGRLRLLGSFAVSSNIGTISETSGASSGPVTFGNGEIFFVFQTDRNAAGNIGDETWVAFLDRSLSQVWMYAVSDSTWHNMDGANDGAPFYGIDSILNIASNLANMDSSATYYVADGGLRIANTQFGLGSYVGGVDAVDGTNVSSEIGASSLWIGHINRSFTSDIVASGWHTLPAVIQEPTSNTFLKGSSNILYPSAAIGPNVNAGTFGLGLTIERNKGDGTLKLQGRKIYASYTFDGSQESLPVEIGTIGIDDLPLAPTNSTLGYEVALMRAADYGASTLYLDGVVHDQDDGTKKNWESSGTFTVEDNTGQTQTLQYTTASYHQTRAVASISRSSTTLTLVTDYSLAAIAGDKVEIFGATTSEYNGTRTLATLDNTNKTYTFTVADSGATAADTTGDSRLGGTKLAGVVGWVDNGSCSLNYTLDEVILTDGGDNYTSNPTVTVTGGDYDIQAEMTANISGNDYIGSLAITKYGDGYESVPTIEFSSGGGSGATAICTITGKLSTESLCTNKGGSWTSSELASGNTCTYDPPGEIEERDENLAVRLNLTYKPADYSDGSDWGKTILAHKYGGPRVTHVNFYSNKYEDDAGTIPESEDFAHLGSFDLQNGFQVDPETWREWADDVTAGQTDQKVCNTDFVGSLLQNNYQMRTGKYPDTNSIDCRWKTAVVINRRVYAGNVLMKDTAGIERVYPDRVIKSLPNQFDVFPDYDTLDATINDGDEIVYLETFGGKLLQFKKKTLYVIDITQEPEYIAGTFRYRGIPNIASAAKADEGIVFANKHGVFIFNGEGVSQLSKGKIDSEWEDFYDDTDFPIVSFEPTESIVVIAKANSEDFLYFSVVTKSWAKGNGSRSSSDKKSQFFDFQGDMYQGRQASSGSTGRISFYKWEDKLPNDLAITDTHKYESKEYDFGDPAIDTVLFNVKMTYKASGTSALNAELKINYNDGTGPTEETLTTSGFDGTSDQWKTIEFKPSSGRINCKTASVIVQSTASNELDSNFEINDFTLVYRNKRIK